MKKEYMPLLAAGLACAMTLTGCSGNSTPSSSQPQKEPEVYQYVSTDVMVPTRSTQIPATLVVPEGAEGQTFPLVVLNHGHGGNREELSGIAEKLGEKGIASIRMDFPGCGQSEEEFTQNSLFNLIVDSNASREYALKNAPVDSTRMGIFGYSMGGRVALDIATGPDNVYQAVGLLAPSADNGMEMMVKFLGGQESYNAHYAQATSEQGYTDFTTQFGQEQQLSLLWFEDLKNSYPLTKMGNFTGDLLVVYGDRDDVVDPEVSKSVVEAAKTTARSAQGVEIEGADHGYGFYSDETEIRDQVEAAIISFYVEKLK